MTAAAESLVVWLVMACMAQSSGGPRCLPIREVPSWERCHRAQVDLAPGEWIVCTPKPKEQ